MTNYKDWIEDYINDELTVEQRGEFEQRLLFDRELLIELEDYRKVKSRLNILRIRQKVKVVHAKELRNLQRKETLKWMGIAATFLLLLVSFILYRISNDQSNLRGQIMAGQDDTNQHKDTIKSVTPVPQDSMLSQWSEIRKEGFDQWVKDLTSHLVMIQFNVVREMSSDSGTYGKKMEQVQELLDGRKYYQAKKILDTLERNYKFEEIHFLKAWTLFNMADYKEAGNLFLILSGSQQYHYEAEWNYILCLFMEKKFHTAGKLVEKINSDPLHPYYQQNQKLRNIIKR